MKFWGLLSLAILAFSSCTEENDIVVPENDTEADSNTNTDTNVDTEIFKINARIANIGQTRATVNPDDGYSFKWQQDDSFVIYQSTDLTKANTFTIDNESISKDGKSADFSSKDFSVTDDATYYAFYPQGVTASGNTFTYTIPETVYIQSDDNDTEHLKSGLIMFAKGTSSEVQNGISFTHKTALFRFGIKNSNSETVTIKSFKLSSTDLECFAKQYSYNTDGSETMGEKSTSLSLGFGEQGISIEAGDVMKAYTLAVPADKIAENETETFTLEVTFADNTTKSITIELNSADSFVAGKYYTFNINLRQTPEIASVEIGDLLHNETTALVESGKELVIKGEGFGSVKDDISLSIGETKVEITSINDTEIKFIVPADFTEGKISISLPGVSTPLEYGTIFKPLTANTDVTGVVLKNYKAPFTPLDNVMLRSGEWMKPLDWTVVNRTATNDPDLTGFAIQLNPKGKKENGVALALQTNWGFANSVSNGKIYQKTYLVPGRYRLTANLLGGGDFAVTNNSKAYLAVSNTEDFSVMTENISNNTLGNKDLTAGGDSYFEFNVITAQIYTIGFIATLNIKDNWVKVTQFKLEYLGPNQQ